jgi:hypothetical protein
MSERERADGGELKRRADEILGTMPEDGRPMGDRINDAVRIALGNLKAEEYWRKDGGAPEEEEEEERSSWEPVNLTPILEGDADPEPPPKMLGRSDGECLLYAGKVHLFAGEPEGAKGWLAMLTAKERIAAGEHVLYVDFEDEAAAAVDRLVALGVSADAIAARFHYLRPDEPLNDAGRAAIERGLETFGPTLAVIDGLTDGLAIHGIDLRDNTEVANWMRDLPQGLRRLASPRS